MIGYNAVIMRKSTRRYRLEPLSETLLNKIKQFPDSIPSLYENTGIRFDVLPRKIYEDTHKKISVKAPYYLVITSYPEHGYLENAGYMGELFVLELTKLGLGTCWMGSAEPQGLHTVNGQYCISIAFGTMAFGGQFRHSVNDFQRKRISDYILYGSDNCNSKLLDLIQAARLAPSAMNGQPVRYLVQGNKIHVYRKLSFWKQKNAGANIQRIDVGIALANMVSAGNTLRTSVYFCKEPDIPAIRSMVYVTTAHVSFLPSEESLL